jgi:hypothetical protein
VTNLPVSNLPVVLDAAGLDGLAAARPPDELRALLAEAHRRGREVLVPALVCAEVARGRQRTRALEAAVSRHDRVRGERPPLRLVDTDFRLASRSAPSSMHPRAAATGSSMRMSLQRVSAPVVVSS